jgi:hypothetical protein
VLLLCAAAEGGHLAEYAAIDELLAKGLQRLTNKGTWKVWQCEVQDLFNAEAFCEPPCLFCLYCYCLVP